MSQPVTTRPARTATPTSYRADPAALARRNDPGLTVSTAGPIRADRARLVAAVLDVLRTVRPLGAQTTPAAELDAANRVAARVAGGERIDVRLIADACTVAVSGRCHRAAGMLADAVDGEVDIDRLVQARDRRQARDAARARGARTVTDVGRPVNVPTTPPARTVDKRTSRNRALNGWR